LQQAIGDFSVAINNLRIRLDRETTLTATLNRDFVLKHLDMEWIDKVTEYGKLTITQALIKYQDNDLFIPAVIKNLTALDKDAICNLLMYDVQVFGGTRRNQMQVYADASSLLMEILREKYHFK
jgi:hypothetical protein